jgi:poly-gamma-glutamate capsule biosynthesis protein CapA/YwtB (metallophosphatase superfamily)
MILAGDYIPKQKAVRLDLLPGTILANLEGPILGDHLPAPSPKAGPNLYSRACETDGRSFIFALANNHMMDYGVEGVESTKAVLTKAGIPFCGAGANLEDARQPLIVEEDGKKIGIISCCERQFGCAEADRPGVAEKGLWLFEAVRQLKPRTDFVIVSCHAAFEHAPFPSPRLREFYHLLIDAGADVIHGHHSHVPQGWESYHNGVIFYGMGNFVVDPAGWNFCEHHCWSIAAEVCFSGDKPDWRIFYTKVELLSNGVIGVRECMPEERNKCVAYRGSCKTPS